MTVKGVFAGPPQLPGTDTFWVALVITISVVIATCVQPPPPDDPPVTTTVPPVTTTAPPDPPDPPPTSRPQDYIQWTCHASKPTCVDRFGWSRSLDIAYSVWRGERDLAYLHNSGGRYLKGGDRELIDMTSGELAGIIAAMESVNARGDRTIHRIETLQHRDFDPDPLAPWHRSQVRKDVATEMREELEEETDNYGTIAAEFPAVEGCDSIACKVDKLNEQ